MNEFDPGPFAPLVGYVGAIIAAVFLIGSIWRGSLAAWQSPEENLPGTASKIVGVACGIGIVVLWVYATPSTLPSVVRLAVVFGVLLIIFFLVYSFFIGALTYQKKIAINNSHTNTEEIVGGLWLLKEAKESQKEHNVTTQTLLAGATYEPDKLWSRASRNTAKTLLVLLFLGIMISGTLGISSAGFAVQVRLTEKPAASVITTDQAPGIEPEDIESQ